MVVRERLFVGGRVRNPGSGPGAHPVIGQGGRWRDIRDANVVPAVRRGGGAPPVMDSIAVAGGRIVAVGTERVARSRLGGVPERIPLEGATVLPGFVEAHAHFKHFAIQETRIDVSSAGSPEEAGDLVAREARAKVPGNWIQGRGWNKNRWPGGGFPHRRVLDRVAPGHPVALWSHDGHVLWMNRRALEATGTWSPVPRGDGGEFETDGESGEPTGIATERMADLVRDRLPLPSRGETKDAMRRGMARLAALGITALHNFEGTTDLGLYEEFEREQELRLRFLIHFADLDLEHALALGLASGFGSPFVRLGAVKVYLDGALTSQTAHMLEPYEGSASRGVEVTRREAFESVVARALAGGIVPAVHAIGDAANRIALDVFERHPAPDGLSFRPRIEHAQTVHPSDLSRFAALGVVASIQPCHLFEDMRTADRYLGARASRAFPIASLVRAGTAVAFGSDAPIENPDPRLGLFAAIARRRLDGTPRGGWHPQEAIDVETALAIYTRGGAVAGGAARTQGVLAPGMDADFVVLDRDPAEVDPEEIPALQVVRTVVAGEDTFLAR